MHVGWSQWDTAPHSPQVPIGWAAWQGAGSESHRLSPLVSWQAEVPALLTLPALQQGLFGVDYEALDKFTAGELEGVRRLTNRKKLGANYIFS